MTLYDDDYDDDNIDITTAKSVMADFSYKAKAIKALLNENERLARSVEAEQRTSATLRARITAMQHSILLLTTKIKDEGMRTDRPAWGNDLIDAIVDAAGHLKP